MPAMLPYLLVLPSIVYSLVSLSCVLSWLRKKPERPPFLVPVTILKPVKGMDAESLENFSSFCRQDYPCFQIVFAVSSADDPALEVISLVKRAFPDRQIDVVIDGTLHGHNHKVSNLINALPAACHDILIICDSDIRVGPDYLKEVTAHFSDRTIGLVTSLYRSSGIAGGAAALEAMGLTSDLIPNVMIAVRLEGLSFALGASMAVRREALDDIGGFSALSDYLADDYQLGNRVGRAGYRLALSDYYVESVIRKETLQSVLSRQLRWSRTMRASRPGGYFLSGLIQPFPAALLALATGSPFDGAAAILLLYLIRSIVVTTFSVGFVRDGIFPRWLWLLPLRDAVGFCTWAMAFVGNRVRWRGNTFRVLRDGRLEEIRP